MSANPQEPIRSATGDGSPGFSMPSMRALVPYVAFILIFAFFSVTAFERFDTFRNFSTILQQATVLAVVAFGMHFVITAGSIDLSVGSTLSLAGLIGAAVSVSWGLWGIAAALAVGAVIGLFNGLVFTYMKVPSFMVSLGTLLAVQGLTIVYSRSNPIPVGDVIMSLGVFPNIVYVAAAIFVICFILYNYTTFGRYCTAIGGDERVSDISGLPVNTVKVSVFIVSGLLAGLGGIVMAARLGAATPTAGTSFELSVISAVVLGGTPLTGGVGAIQNTVIGALIIAMLGNGLIILGISSETQKIITGLILILAVFLSLERGKIGVIK
ncbi:ABC transporter permease [Mesorhizobium sp. CA13]|uniref:ABC transporter permease n=1 Tax=unclassified Mesorhizobium TaxID=325217 RepID=UPI0011260FBA|nr:MULTISPECIES: ABC transporter permease [unclassified Mesorhizobium]MBZ9856487.1 ABC transporter permease [Mesorhizobium sp. CA13]MBZ9965766.1 ABC transporter permease [Mesorhizobium sp. BR1-1-2]MCA0011883.1 ABC transporter permease [Mesorhizobium sp. B294B1A1]MCA0038137.1 ABC transporter permease [Mesorhizobium sp. B292B1B]TPM44128.1 ABC transporter permease [Mesorhizobium sp. B2-3-2]